MHYPDYDIVIVGGGIAGFAAAYSAAEIDRKVLLVESAETLGGNATLANVGTICGAFHRVANSQPIAVGYPFCQTFVDQVRKASSTTVLSLDNGLSVVPYEYQVLQEMILDLLTSQGVTVWNRATLTGAHCNFQKITSLTVAHQNKEIKIHPQGVVDASGNGIVSSLLGLATIQSESYQAASQIFRIGGISCPGEFQLAMAIQKALSQWIHRGEWTLDRPQLDMIPGSLRNGNVDLKLTLPHRITDHLESNEQIRQQAIEQIQRIFPLLQESVGYLSQSHLVCIFPQLGIRVMRRSQGKYVLTTEDVLQGRKFADPIAVGTWPIEKWGYDGKVSLQFSAAMDGYHIPAMCLSSSAIENLFFAGKNISATDDAIASARVMGTGLQTGYAAGRLVCSQSATIEKDVTYQLGKELLGE